MLCFKATTTSNLQLYLRSLKGCKLDVKCWEELKEEKDNRVLLVRPPPVLVNLSIVKTEEWFRRCIIMLLMLILSSLLLGV